MLKVIGAAAAVLLGSMAAAYGTQTAPARVLRVGTYAGIPGNFSSIQAAIKAARPGDWILVAPGDYHERGSQDPDHAAGVYITTPGIHLRGLDRNATIVDGTLPGPGGPCRSAANVQDRGPKAEDGKPAGRNGIFVAKASGVTIDNLTVCNFMSSEGGQQGNQIWWNGGDGSGRIGLGSYAGSYLTATTTYSAPDAGGQYGIFVSNADGPGVIAHTYASNMADSSYYVGACADCNATLTDAHAEHSALGFSGTNAGGHLIIENSRFDDNKAGLAPNALNNDDAPPPQDGACPGTSTDVGPGLSTGPVRHCMIIRNNMVDHNNDPNVPGSGIAGAAPVGTGIEVSGGRNILVVGNDVEDNGAWGIVVHDYPDTEQPPAGTHCQGGVGAGSLPVCLFQAFGNEIAGNHLAGNGGFHNPTNGDLAADTTPHAPGNCFHGNVDPGGLTTWPPVLTSPVYATCGLPNGGDLTLLTAELVCDSGLLGPCPSLPGLRYPRASRTTILALKPQRTMPNPCAGVPANPWCKR